MRKIHFNNGFVTAITLFLEHKNFDSHLVKDRNNNVNCDLRLYGATDHLYDMEIPKFLSDNIIKRIVLWKRRCFKYRLEHFRDTKITDKLFKEAEQILKAIDEQVFNTNKVIMRYR